MNKKIVKNVDGGESMPAFKKNVKKFPQVWKELSSVFHAFLIRL